MARDCTSKGGWITIGKDTELSPKGLYYEQPVKDKLPEFGKRYYIRTAPYALAEAIAALDRNECVSEICISMEDNDLMITYTYDKYATERDCTCGIKKEHSTPYEP